MPTNSATAHLIRATLIAVAVFAMSALSPGKAQAQIVVMVNGSPITALDIEQRTKFERLTSRRNLSRQEVTNILIDDRLKVFIAKRYGVDVTDAEVDQAIQGMARRTQATAAQLESSLAQQGISINTLKAKARADLSWSQIVRGRYSSTLKIGEGEVDNALRSRGLDAKDAVGYIYKLYPITVVVAQNASPADVDAKRRIAESLRSRFQNCNEGLRLARALRDVAVREPISRNSSEMSPQLQEVLNKLEVGQLTTPERAAQGLQMFALCDKKTSTTETTAKREVREEIYSKRFEERGKQFLEEVRRSAMIEYR